MFIKRIESVYTYLENGFRKEGKRILTYGKYKGKGITVDNFYKGDKINDKRFVIFDENMQAIFWKKRKFNKGFEVIG